jgi:hypothetical protein
MARASILETTGNLRTQGYRADDETYLDMIFSLFKLQMD